VQHPHLLNQISLHLLLFPFNQTMWLLDPKPKTFPDFKMYQVSRYPISTFLSALSPLEPSTFKQASTKPEWIEAMTHEYNALFSNQTWTLCPRPSHHNVVRNKWVFKVKQKSDGSVDKFKACLVAKGFEQNSGIDYHETFSPVIKPATIRLILSLAVQFDWQLRQLDVSNAFLHRVLEDEVYMEQPQGFVDPSFPNHVCRLHKSIYGLKHAPRAWFKRLSTALLEHGFVESHMDYSLFICHAGSIHVFLLIYVDDIIITGNNPAIITLLIDKLQSNFALKDLGDISYFLGIQAVRNSEGLHLRQSKYAIDLLQRVNMEDSKPYRALCIAGSKMSKFDGEALSDPTTFRHVVGALQYITLTRLDLAYSVNQLCQHMHNPTTTWFSSFTDHVDPLDS